MATILLTWELGGGLGHIMRLRPVGKALVDRGHTVVAAVRNLALAREHFHAAGISVIPAPVTAPRPIDPSQATAGFAQILEEVGFGDGRIEPLFEAWNTLLDYIKPQLVITDHSPSALLALRGRGIPCANMGLAFFCPPPTTSLPVWDLASLASLQKLEESLCRRLSSLLEARRRPPLRWVSQLYNEGIEPVLATYREFDHYGARQGCRYWGHWPFGSGVQPQWPSGQGPKIFAYLKQFQGILGIEEALGRLKQLGAPTLVVANLPAPLKEQFACQSLRFEAPVDLEVAARECDVAITNANHGTTVSFLLAGKPCVLMPIFVEQEIFGHRVQEIGAGRLVPARSVGQFSQALEAVINDGTYKAKAQIFAARYAHFKPGQQITELVDYLERMVQK